MSAISKRNQEDHNDVDSEPNAYESFKQIEDGESEDEDYSEMQSFN